MTGSVSSDMKIYFQSVTSLYFITSLLIINLLSTISTSCSSVTGAIMALIYRSVFQLL